jgi:hypothetical protein
VDHVPEHVSEWPGKGELPPFLVSVDEDLERVGVLPCGHGKREPDRTRGRPHDMCAPRETTFAVLAEQPSGPPADRARGAEEKIEPGVFHSSQPGGLPAGVTALASRLWTDSADEGG